VNCRPSGKVVCFPFWRQARAFIVALIVCSDIVGILQKPRLQKISLTVHQEEPRLRNIPLTVHQLASMGGKARARKLSPEQQSAIGSTAVAAREADRSFAKADLREEMRDEYRVRYRSAVLDELRMHEADLKEEYPAKRRRLRNELRKKLEDDLRREVRSLFGRK